MMRPVTVVLGGQWGDEGKGKVVDCLSADMDVVVRFQGGANAGHTVLVDNQKYVLHLVPTGVLHEGVLSFLGPGMVVDTWGLIEELDALAAVGVDAEPRLRLATGANLVLPHHKRLDELREKSLSRKSIGTTGRGIGPAYEDKMGRLGLRGADLLREDDNLRRMVIERVLRANQYLAERYDAPPLASEAIADEMVAHAQRLRPLVVSTYEFLAPLRSGKWSGLLEGAQGTLLDVDHGSYPFVTSSNCTVGGAVTGSGIPPQRIDRVLLVMKAYCTRVGNGPFPTELHGEEAEALRAAGAEFGATTGRPRRCGWFDAVAAKYAADINGATEIALTKLDVLTGVETIRVATHYEVEGRPVDWFPADGERMTRAKPVYTEFPGWDTDFAGASSFDQLPKAAQNYIAALEDLMDVKIRYISTGQARDAWMDRLQPTKLTNKASSGR